MKPEIEPFARLYEFVIKYNEPMISSKCPLRQTYTHGIAEYLLNEGYHIIKDFKPDFLFDWAGILHAIQTFKPNHTMFFPIAFRKNSIDGPNDILFQMERGRFREVYASKKVYLLVCVADDTDVHLSLYSIYDDIINNCEFFRIDPFHFYYAPEYRRIKSLIRDLRTFLSFIKPK